MKGPEEEQAKETTSSSQAQASGIRYCKTAFTTDGTRTIYYKEELHDYHYRFQNIELVRLIPESLFLQSSFLPV